MRNTTTHHHLWCIQPSMFCDNAVDRQLAARPSATLGHLFYAFTSSTTTTYRYMHPRRAIVHATGTAKRQAPTHAFSDAVSEGAGAAAAPAHVRGTGRILSFGTRDDVHGTGPRCVLLLSVLVSHCLYIHEQHRARFPISVSTSSPRSPMSATNTLPGSGVPASRCRALKLSGGTPATSCYALKQPVVVASRRTQPAPAVAAEQTALPHVRLAPHLVLQRC